MICPYLNNECVYAEWSDQCHSYCRYIALEEIKHQKEERDEKKDEKDS